MIKKLLIVFVLLSMLVISGCKLPPSMIECKCEGCNVNWYNPTSSENEENHIDISCCYKAIKDENGVCRYYKQHSILNITEYRVWQ